MYNSLQLLYIIISLFVTVSILIASSFLKREKHKDWFLKFWALATFIIHISIMWVNYLKFGKADAPSSVLFPIFFCNASMYLLLIVAFMKNKKGKAFYYLATFTAYAGMLGALITVFESHYFASSNTNISWGDIKSMLSHSTMLVGCLYLFVGKFVSIRVSNLIPFSLGLIGCGILGIGINSLFIACGLNNPNSMYLAESALSDVPFLTGPFFAGLFLILIFVFTVIWEMFAYKKNERWYNNLHLTFKNKFRKEKKESD